MAPEHRIPRYRRWYAQLLRLYSDKHYARFAEGMEQTFNDLLRERAAQQKSLLSYSLWIFTETAVGICRQKLMDMMSHNKNFLRILLGTLLILLVPMIAMQFTNEVAWDVADFVLAGVLLLGTGLTFDFANRKASNLVLKTAIALAVGGGLFLVWVNLAVGVIGSENHPANLMYAGVLAVGLVGAVISRFEAEGMARTLFAMALAHALVAAIALVAGFTPMADAMKTFVLNGLFVMLWVVSAMLFRYGKIAPNSR